MKTKRFRGVLAYYGRHYHGFQRQAAGVPSIQAALEATLEGITGQKVTVIGAGRTDAGVHATGQVIGFDCHWTHSVEALFRAINVNLPPDIALQNLSAAAPHFHPRFDARRRRYHYQFYNASVRQPLWDLTSWHLRGALDTSLMQKGASMLLGKHDFATFGQAPRGTNTTRTVYQAEFVPIKDAPQIFIIEADAFLQHMVRSIMGTLAELGRGALTLEDFQAAFQAANRRYAGTTAPPHGLTLVNVLYDDAPSLHGAADSEKLKENEV